MVETSSSIYKTFVIITLLLTVQFTVPTGKHLAQMLFKQARTNIGHAAENTIAREAGTFLRNRGQEDNLQNAHLEGLNMYEQQNLHRLGQIENPNIVHEVVREVPSNNVRPSVRPNNVVNEVLQRQEGTFNRMQQMNVRNDPLYDYLSNRPRQTFIPLINRHTYEQVEGEESGNTGEYLEGMARRMGANGLSVRRPVTETEKVEEVIDVLSGDFGLSTAEKTDLIIEAAKQGPKDIVIRPKNEVVVREIGNAPAEIRQKNTGVLVIESEPKDLAQIRKETTDIQTLEQQETGLTNIVEEENALKIVEKGPTGLQTIKKQNKALKNLEQEQKNLQLLPNEQKGIQVVNKGEKNLQVIPEEKTDLALANQGVQDLTVVQEGVKDLSLVNKGVQDLTLVNKGVKDLTVVNDGVKDLTVVNEGVKDLTIVKQQPNSLLTLKPEQKDLTNISQQQTGLRVVKDQVTALKNIAQENKSLILDQDQKGIAQVEKGTTAIIVNNQGNTDLANIQTQTTDLINIQAEEKNLAEVRKGTTDIQARSEANQLIPGKRFDESEKIILNTQAKQKGLQTFEAIKSSAVELDNGTSFVGKGERKFKPIEESEYYKNRKASKYRKASKNLEEMEQQQESTTLLNKDSLRKSFNFAQVTPNKFNNARKPINQLQKDNSEAVEFNAKSQNGKAKETKEYVFRKITEPEYINRRGAKNLSPRVTTITSTNSTGRSETGNADLLSIPQTKIETIKSQVTEKKVFNPAVESGALKKSPSVSILPQTTQINENLSTQQKMADPIQKGLRASFIRDGFRVHPFQIGFMNPSLSTMSVINYLKEADKIDSLKSKELGTDLIPVNQENTALQLRGDNALIKVDNGNKALIKIDTSNNLPMINNEVTSLAKYEKPMVPMTYQPLRGPITNARYQNYKMNTLRRENVGVQEPASELQHVYPSVRMFESYRNPWLFRGINNLKSGSIQSKQENNFLGNPSRFVLKSKPKFQQFINPRLRYRYNSRRARGTQINHTAFYPPFFKQHGPSSIAENLKDSNEFLGSVFKKSTIAFEKEQLFYKAELEKLEIEDIHAAVKSNNIPLSVAQSAFVEEKAGPLDEAFEKLLEYGPDAHKHRIFARFLRIIAPRLFHDRRSRVFMPNLVYDLNKSNFKMMKLLDFKYKMLPIETDAYYETMMDLPYYNLVLNIEGICIEELDVELCSKVSYLLYELYTKFSWFDKKNYTVIESAVTKVLEEFPELLRILRENHSDDLKGHFAGSEHMFNRLEFLLVSYLNA